MSSPASSEKALALLEQDVLLNLMTLKMINSYARHMHFLVDGSCTDWALLSLLPTRCSDWDREAYPETNYVAFIDGTSVRRAQALVRSLPNGAVLVKTANPEIQSHLKSEFGAVRTASYISFTPRTVPSLPEIHIIPGQSEPDGTAWRMFGMNGYSPSELARYFSNGARWFGVRKGNTLASVCFVFENYGRVWEIAGVYTSDPFRRMGLGRTAVVSALRYLLELDRIPRYQAEGENYASLMLATACGLEEFLRVEHYRCHVGW